MNRRSAAWLDDPGKSGFIARSHLRALGLSADAIRDRPVIGIASSASELNPCNAHLGAVAEHVRRGVLLAGGLPLVFPTMSLGEPFMRPTTMLYRNLMAMEVEESLRSQPLDAVVLLAGCDKTVPAQLMGAASVDLPAIMVTGGPMLTGRYRGGDLGSGTDIWRLTESLRAGEISSAEYHEAEGCMSRSAGHCMVMGTASTMAALTEALGVQLSGGAAIPASDSRRGAHAEKSGERAVRLAESGGPRPSELLTREAFENAIRLNAAIGGSTNAVVHLLALAGRVGVPLDLDDIARIGADTPLLVDLKPSGRFHMEDFAYAGGFPAVLSRLAPQLHLDALTVSGRALGTEVADAKCWNDEVIAPFDTPVQPAGHGTVVLRGTLAPDGAVLKRSAASEQLIRHRGPALVFDAVEDYLAVADDPELAVTADSVLVLRNAGPVGYPGMPEVGNLPIPARLLAQGITDIVRVTDARMSGTAYGTVVLHVAPESAVGGPLALVRTGDTVELDVDAGRLDLVVPPEELERRRASWAPSEPIITRGWTRMYLDHVEQADRGADLDILVGGSGHAVPRQPF